MTTVQIGRAELTLTMGDITAVSADAIVNAANSGLLGGGGVDGAIHRAGGPAILDECRAVVSAEGPLPPGHAVATTAGRLHARHVIHTVGPVWRGGHRGEPGVLASAYTESLVLARKLDLASVAFPSISTGAYGYPVDKAADIALREVLAFFRGNPDPVQAVTFVLYDAPTLRAYEEALKALMTAASSP
jgi:O-acetyl-ADP-ribose deacetylase (regulator of RNase III)